MANTHKTANGAWAAILALLLLSCAAFFSPVLATSPARQALPTSSGAFWFSSPGSHFHDACASDDIRHQWCEPRYIKIT